MEEAQGVAAQTQLPMLRIVEAYRERLAMSHGSPHESQGLPTASGAKTTTQRRPLGLTLI